MWSRVSFCGFFLVCAGSPCSSFYAHLSLPDSSRADGFTDRFTNCNAALA
jgi:hypothetical protein